MSVVLRIAGKGDGVTEDGRHVAYAAPGDEVGIDATIVPGPHHRAPPCRHFPRCGGCQLQHVDDDSYAQFVVDRIAGALAAQKLEAVIRAPHLSPPRSRRRATLRVERGGRMAAIGFNEARSHALVDIKQCEILHPALFALVAPLRALLAPLIARGRPAEVAMTLADQGVALLLRGVTAEGLAAAEALTGFAEAHRLARLAIDDGYGAQTWWEPAPATATLGGVAVALPADGFLQATADGEAALGAAVAEATAGAATIADLFAGIGTFALPLSAGAKVYAGEGAREAAAALKQAADTNRRPLFVEHRDLFRRPLVPAELDRFDAVVLDPPRAGAREQAAELARSRVARIAYASCNPQTFARDARLLVDGGWRIGWIRPVGQFRWSTHVELVAAFVR